MRSVDLAALLTVTANVRRSSEDDRQPHLMRGTGRGQQLLSIPYGLLMRKEMTPPLIKVDHDGKHRSSTPPIMARQRAGFRPP